jgi:hypothetical protein
LSVVPYTLTPRGTAVCVTGVAGSREWHYNGHVEDLNVVLVASF